MSPEGGVGLGVAGLHGAKWKDGEEEVREKRVKQKRQERE